MDWRKNIIYIYIFLYTVKPASSQPSAKKHWIISVNCRRPARTLIFTDRLAPRPWAQKSCQEFGGRASKSWIAVPFLGPESGSPHCIYIYMYDFHCTFHQSCVFSSTAKPRPTELDTHEANVQWVSFSLISIIQCATQGFPCFREKNACPHNWRCFATTSSNVVNHRCYLRHFDHL